MIQNALALRLNQRQLAQLMAHLTAYRSHLWQCVIPTSERNRTIRSIQAIQGRLELEQEQGQAEIILALTGEEASTLKQALSGLIHLHGTAQPSEQRTQTLGELAGLRLLVERTLRLTQAP